MYFFPIAGYGDFFSCAYSVVVVIFLDSIASAGCVTVLAFLFSFCYTALYFPSVMLHLYVQLGETSMFIFVSYQLYSDTGYAVAKIVLTTQYYLVPSVPSSPHSCCYDLTHKTSVSTAASNEI